MATHWLECPSCDADVHESTPDGMFGEGPNVVCPHCALISWVSCDEQWDGDRMEHVAYVNDEGEHEDVGQPQCDLSCDGWSGACGGPCGLTCDRSAGFGPIVELRILVEKG